MSSNLTFQEHDLDAYYYDLPEHLIAQSPRIPRDTSRLLVVHRKEGRWEHRTFKDLPEYLDAEDMIVANNTRVLKARLLGRRLRQEKSTDPWVAGGKVEFVMLEQRAPRVWEGLFHASAKYVPGLRFEIPTPDGLGLRGVLIHGSGESAAGTVVAEFDRDPIESGAGELPLPHYIDRETYSQDDTSYQTVYAKKLGSAAAPTAGLHFTEEVLTSLKARGVSWQEVTLNVGLGTFRPVKENDVRKHVMHEESYEVLPAVAEAINTWKKSGKRIFATGTTTARTLESAWQLEHGNYSIRSGVDRTALFIRPGGERQFQVVDRLLTNFHLPRSTLLMLVSAFAGRELILAAYREAVKEEYRFFSYGDAMLLL
jgi:S-adenosylmethionine:tRNA ribosyltransferase-isomerase